MTELIMITVCIVLFIVIRSSLENAKFPGNNTVLAVCVSLLCLIGMRKVLVKSNEPGSNFAFDTVLLPYVALGLTLLFMLVLMGILKLSKIKTEELRKKKSNIRCESDKIRKP